jgi:hypothetical protein
MPNTVEEKAQMYRWMFFLVTEIEQPLWRIARHTFVYPEEKRLPQDVDLARQECLEMVAVLERHMKEREFMVGDRLSVADFNAAYTLDWANEEEMLGDAPRLRDQDNVRPTDGAAHHRRGLRGDGELGRNHFSHVHHMTADRQPARGLPCTCASFFWLALMHVSGASLHRRLG